MGPTARHRSLHASGEERRIPRGSKHLRSPLEEAGAVLRLTGISFRPDDLPELLRAVHEALLASTVQSSQPAPGRASRKRPRFRDLALRFEPNGGGGFRTEILPTTGGGTPADFEPRFPIADLPWIVQGLERSACGTIRTLHAAGHAQARRDPARFGGKLFDALFTGGVRDAYERSSAAARAHGEGLRLRLVLDPTYPALCACPWELLFDRRRGLFLCHDLATPVVRQLETTMPEVPHLAPPDPKLRVLVASAQPAGTPPVAAQDELIAIVETLRRRTGVEVVGVPEATSMVLRRELRRVSPHILHFIGHGTFDEASGEGRLLLTEAGNHSDALSGKELSALFCGLDDLRLVVLNACNTARLPRREGFDVFSGTAAALIQAGFPAVLAMQFPISDDASVRFAEAFYEALGEGDPVEAALVEGRQAILDLDRRRGGFEWATPVLYLRVQDGDLFGFGGRTDAQTRGDRP